MQEKATRGKLDKRTRYSEHCRVNYQTRSKMNLVPRTTSCCALHRFLKCCRIFWFRLMLHDAEIKKIGYIENSRKLRTLVRMNG